MTASKKKKCQQRGVVINTSQLNGNFTDFTSINEKMRRDHKERQNIVLWRMPLITLPHFSLEILLTMKE
uniref:Uncharacterized protein n=1 Tax=Equus asinus TaxID=9793 RepID=A0A8C4L717_EQUAS